MITLDRYKQNLKRVLVTVVLISTIYALGTQNGEQNILDRWENRWFESDWYDTKSIEEFLYDTDYSIELGE